MIRYGQQSKFAKEVIGHLEPLQPKIDASQSVISDEELDAPQNPVEADIDDEDTPQ